jgi:L-fuculose-phosphate aldolase
MANHGAIVYGASLSDAVANTELLEWACTLYWRAASLGTPRTLDEDEQAAVVEAVVARAYGTTQVRDEQ